MRGIALSLGLPSRLLRERCTADPLILFRIFHYPPPVPAGRDALGRRRAHRLRPADDPAAGRRRRPARCARRAGWVAAPPVPRVVRLQHRRHARPHDRRPATAPRRTACATPAARDRLSFPFFFDPTSTRASSRWRTPRRPTTTPRAGTAPASTPSRAPTATTCWPRSARSSPSCEIGAVGFRRGTSSSGRQLPLVGPADGRNVRFAANADSSHSIQRGLNGWPSRRRPQHTDPSQTRYFFTAFSSQAMPRPGRSEGMARPFSIRTGS